MNDSDEKTTPENRVADENRSVCFWKISGSNLLRITLEIQISGVLVPYMFNVQRMDYDPPLPFISQAAGCFPENGLFTVSMITASFFGILLCFLLHGNTESKSDNFFPRIINMASFSCCFAYFSSWIIIIAFPFGYTDVPNKFEWVYFILCEHMFGALLMLGSCVFFSIFQTILSWEKRTLNARLKITMVIVPAAVIGMYTLINLGFEELEVKDGLSLQDVSYELPLKLSSFYLVTSICEWIIVTSMWLSLRLFNDELQNSTLYLCIHQKESEATRKFEE